jgi:Co/Zn/Cd efflux system component
VTTAIVVVAVIAIAPALVSTLALARRSRHDRAASMIAAYLMAIVIPAGTAVAALTLWLALKPRAHIVEYRHQRTPADTYG